MKIDGSWRGLRIPRILLVLLFLRCLEPAGSLMLISDFWKYPEPNGFFFEKIKEQYNIGKKTPIWDDAQLDVIC
jgi:hypothetical protein